MPTMDAILIAGPTASGKSAAALALAEAFNGAIINADSMQVYAELRILTARPTAAQEALAPHHLYGCVSAGHGFSVGQWLTHVRDVLDEVQAKGQVPIFTGGTGLYFRALIEGLSPIPDIPLALREDVRNRLAAQGPEALHGVLAAKDAEMAGRLKPTDRQRIARALEVMEATGCSLSEWQKIPGEPLLHGPTAKLLMMPPRDVLYARCDARFDEIMAGGGLEEVAALDALGLDPDLPAMKALGVPFLRAHLAGELDLAGAVASAKTQTRRYAKRQSTFFRNQFVAWNRFIEKDSESFNLKMFSYIRNFG